jgi:hypothetical protein
MATTFGMASQEGEGINAQEKEGVKLQQEECCGFELQRVPLLVPEGRF